MIDRFILRNNGGQKLTIMLEPWVEFYAIMPGEEIEIRGDFGEHTHRLEVDYGHDGHMAMWVPANTTVWKNGVQLEPR